MTEKEKKVIFSIVGVMLLILLIVVAVKVFGGNDKEKPTNRNTITNNATAGQENASKEEYVEKLDNGIKFNNSEELNKTKRYKNIEISNIQFLSKDNESVLIADLKNTGSSETTSEMARMKILGNNNELITEFDVFMSAMKAGETKKLTIKVVEDIVNAKDLVIEPKM